MSLAWLLNLDADDELANAPPAESSPEKAARIRAFGARTGLAIEGDVVIDDATRADGLGARAWMPTPRALARIAAAGGVVPQAPSFEVLRRVNHRRFAFELGPTVDGAVLAQSEGQALAALERSTEGGFWLVKTPHGFAGRGRLLVHEGRRGADVQAFLRGAFSRNDSVLVEPKLDRTADFALHGFVATDGEITLGTPTIQRCDEAGVWRETSLASPGDLALEEQSALVETALRVARALGTAGYFGPFGVDAFRYVDAEGAAHFHPLCEINARFAMGYAIGMGPRRPDREDR